jgi:hypothetical protein
MESTRALVMMVLDAGSFAMYSRHSHRNRQLHSDKCLAADDDLSWVSVRGEREERKQKAR